jgi:alpha-tubulin suppressor-like RCC1 family protein
VLKVETVKAHTCALRTAEPKVVCWGSNTYYEKMIISHALGPKAAGIPYSARPVPVELEGDAIDIGMGFESSYAVTQDGRVFGWGYNGRAQLGVNNLETVVPVPSLVFSDVGPEPQPLLGATEVLRTDGSHQCARVGPDFSAASSADQSPYVCWGSNDWGELGFGASALGHTMFRFALPARTLPKTAKTLVMGEDHACFSATENGETKLFCYGNGASVGNGATGADAPVQWRAQPVVWDPVNFASFLADTAKE